MIEIHPDDLVLCIHGRGLLTDLVLQRTASGGATVAVLPCCHDLMRSDAGGVEGWGDGPLAVGGGSYRSRRSTRHGLRSFDLHHS